jgi:hypothetical protein
MVLLPRRAVAELLGLLLVPALLREAVATAEAGEKVEEHG